MVDPAEGAASPQDCCPPVPATWKRDAQQMNLVQSVMQAKRAFGRVAGQPWCVTPAVPVLFFGDLNAYRDSPLRVLTVGLNPSLHEFPSDRPFRRFPLAENCLDRDASRYLDAMSAYFRVDPYRGWFNAFKPLLDGLGASYYEDAVSTALHTDICSPVATNPTWNKLDNAVRTSLEADGRPLWHTLLATLKPQIVAVSVAKAHLERIEFPSRTEWQIVHTFTRTRTGALRSRPYELSTRWYDVGSARSMFVFGRAAQKPFGLLSDTQKGEAGKILLEAYRNGR